MTLEQAAYEKLKAQIEYLAFSIDQLLELEAFREYWPSLVRLKTNNLDLLAGLQMREQESA